MYDDIFPWAVTLAPLRPFQMGCGALTVLLLATFLYKMRNSPNYPPGPPRDPVFGNARQMTGDHIELKFTEWGKRYGESICVRSE